MRITSQSNPALFASLPQSPTKLNKSPDFDPLVYIRTDSQSSPSVDTPIKSSIFKINGIKVNLDGNIVHHEQDALLKMIQDIYMKIVDQELYFSVDQQKWHRFEDMFYLDCSFDFPIESGKQETELHINLLGSTIK